MDIKLEKKPWYIRYRYYLIGGILFVAFLIYVITLSLGPRKLRIDAEDIQIAEVKAAITSNSDFMQASCSLQSELRHLLGICSTSRFCFPLLNAIVLRV